jgi:two-component system chemotaxis response regulator CheB
MKTKLLVIDAMPLARKALAEALRASEAIEVVAVVSGAGAAERKLPAARPDVILLDVQPPVGPEVEALRRLKELWPVPIVLFTALEGQDREEVIDVLQVPRSAVLAKPATNLAQRTADLAGTIEEAIRKVHQDDRLRWKKKRRELVAVPRPLRTLGTRVIAIGASTGGTEAITEVLARLPADVPGLVIVQHMPSGFTRMFAERLNEVSELKVKEAADGDEVRPGQALLAPGGYQMELVPAGDGYAVHVWTGEKVNGHCPSVDVLMLSVARLAGRLAIGVLLTGMGSDGAEGMKAIRQAGGGTIAQDEASSVVYGMPREAYLRGGAAQVVSLAGIPKHILALVASERA